MLQKRLLATLIALSSTPLFAAQTTPEGNNTFTVTTPNLKPGFEFNIAALWLKPGASNLNYVILNKELPTQSPTWNEQELRPSYSPGFNVGVRYIFKEASSNDIQLNWTHFSSTTSSTTTADNVNFFLGPDYEIGPGGIPIRNANGKVQFKYDVVNLDVGQFVSFGQHVNMRFFGGLSTGFLRENITTTYSGNRVTTFPGPFSMTQNVYSNFTGIGPRAGIAADYSNDNGFGVLGEAAVSALIGSMHSSTSYTGSGQELLDTYGQTTNYQTIKDQNVTQVIPGLDAKLGISYRHTFKNQTVLKVTAGYEGAVYVNAISQYTPASLVEGQGLESGGIFVATMNHTLSNYSVQGPFLNFAWQC